MAAHLHIEAKEEWMREFRRNRWINGARYADRPYRDFGDAPRTIAQVLDDEYERSLAEYEYTTGCGEVKLPPI